MIAILGAGKMGEALISGLLRAGVSPSGVLAAVRRPERADQLHERYGIETVSAAEAVEAAETLIIAVKPQDISGLLREIAANVTAGHFVISVAAGIRTSTIEHLLGVDVAIVRVMTNTSALVDEAMSVISAGKHATEEHLQRVEELFRPVGEVLRVSESQQDAATALSGTGPAYLYLLAEAMIDAGIQLGIPSANAIELVTQTLYGAATMLRSGGEHPAILREAVTSPGGTTSAAMRELEDRHVRAAFLAAAEAARDRAAEMSRANDPVGSGLHLASRR